MAKAIWKGVVIAESDTYEMVEGNVYFPMKSIKKEFFKECKGNSICPWKGVAYYYSVSVKGNENKNGAWYYPNPSKAARKIKDHVAFWQGIRVEK